ncbi:hypothetical protein CYQ88_02570 [Hydrogenovibrio sp. SC-1]|uniref:UvrD-helicase domain-containing protein n=1 Tax=Hydrogenovibrio sp. SC-1 TaxID=2065820 RepID=UPI000C7B80BC|nr:UvrD-helicase domain-containing protein [Hydrogenovibrio sp. SC-1]PLA75129.1 hypothetical protein CYQ88_02570 [Hydrogenovibrio sp. SC-1]
MAESLEFRGFAMNLTPSQYQMIDPLQQCQPDRDLADGPARFQAISPADSFIVQAPAGSGKTALLTQRFLALLSQVEQPEQVVAMTFTKKAAAEMRNRILQALQFGLQSPPSAAASLFERNSWQLAQAALHNNQQRGWQLLDNPNRLRIRTLDSMNGYLVQQMPLLSRLGAQPQLASMQDRLYIQAARSALQDTETAEASTELLRLVNGKLRRAEALLVSMLKKRDQWMSSLLGYGADTLEESAMAREVLEAAVADLVAQEQQAAWKHISPIADRLSKMCAFSEFAEANVEEPLKSNLQQLIAFDQSGQSLCVDTDLAVWRALTDWLQTKQGTWLKTANKNKGFPPGKGDNKAQKDAFLAELEAIRTADFQDKAATAFAQLSQLPDATYSDADWHSLQQLIRLLNRSVGHLKVCFQQAGETDFIEVAQAAALALGEDSAPTDLAQQLDYQIRHLLIDEFQDTSVAQFRLIEKLVTAWTPGDGHTLFIVGDPMQSIYRFREAEVGNFLQAWEDGIAQVDLIPLQLSVNFRSSAGVVDWVNQTFQSVFPSDNQLELGAVCYSSAEASPSAIKSHSTNQAVFNHWQLEASQSEEVNDVLSVIQSRLADSDFLATESIGVLGRSRSHLMPIAFGLKQAGIAFKAVELEGLKDRQEIQDCQALTRALIHLGDRPAWIALLRSPLIGLSLADLNTLLTEDGRPKVGTAWQQLMAFPTDETDQNDQAWADFKPGLSEAGQMRLAETLPVLQQALQSRGSLEVSVWLRQIWLALDGPQTVLDDNALQNVEAYWQMLTGLAARSSSSSGGTSLSIAVLEETLEQLFAQPDASPDAKRVELMTMHKSKGLEFDTVILPSLGRKPRVNEPPLVSWLSFRGEQKEQLVIAPLVQKGKANGQKSPLVELIKRYDAQKQTYEDGRLLYVACTRAKRQLHCFGSVAVSDKVLAGDVALAATNNSLLSCLWPLVATSFEGLLQGYQPKEAEGGENDFVAKVSRLPPTRKGFHQMQPESFMSALLPKKEAAQAVTQLPAEPLSKSAMDVSQQTPSQTAEMAKLVGVWVHQVLEQWSKNNPIIPSVEALASQSERHALGLMQLGLRGQWLTEGMRRVMVSLQNSLQNELVLWALRSDHAEAAAELPLSSLELLPLGQVQQNHIVDRTFVDEEGTRWIVDYKTSYVELNDAKEVDAFIEGQVSIYRPQLQRYGQLFSVLENRPQKWVLYFSHLDRWVEVADQLSD